MAFLFQWVRDVRRGLFFWLPKKHRSVTTQILLPDMILRCDTENKGNKTILSDIVFVRQDAKKGARSTMALDRRCFFFK